jgi:hypothetical protein
MKAVLCLLMSCPLAFAAPCPTGQTKDESALVQMEQTWARALEQNDAPALGCILAAEFEDAGPDGKLTDRAATLASSAGHHVVHHELTELHAHVMGNFGYIRGVATAVDEQHTPLVSVRFTDIYVYRNGRWQCVAGHESTVSDAGH